MRIARGYQQFIAIIGLGLAYSSNVLAEASTQLWPALQESFFAGNCPTVLNGCTFMRYNTSFLIMLPTPEKIV